MVQLISGDPTVVAKPEIEQLESIRKLVVVPEARGVRRSKMLGTPQEVGKRPRALGKKEQGKKAAYEPNCAKKCGRGKEESGDFTDMTVKYVLVNGLAEAETRNEVLDRNLLEDNFRAETVAFMEQKETARDALKGVDEDESSTPIETPRDVLGWDLLDGSSWADAVTFIEQKEVDRDACRGEAVIVKTGYGGQQTTGSPDVEAKLLQKNKCGRCEARANKIVGGKLRQWRGPRLCKTCWNSTLQSRDIQEPEAKADKEDTGQAEGELSLAASNTWSTSCQSTGATKVRIRARNRNRRAQQNNVKFLGADDSKVTISQGEEGVIVALHHHTSDYGSGWLQGKAWE